MDATLELVVCSNYRSEVETVVRSEGWQDVRVGVYGRMCGHPQQKIPRIQTNLRDLQGKENVAVINCQRMQPGLAASNFYQLPQCFYMLVNQSLVDDALRQGSYILTPNWLAHWSKHLAEWGFTQSTARQFFKESMTGLLLLDTGLDDQNSCRLAELSTYLDLQAKSLPVGLDFLRLYLTQIVSAWRAQNQLKKIETMNVEANRTAADYAMVVDLLTRLTQVQSEEEAHSEIADLFTMLFSLGNVLYFPLDHGQLLQTQSHSLADDEQRNVQSWLDHSSEPFTYTSSGKGFYLRIEHQNQTLGVLLADEMTLPQYMDQYLNLSLMISKLCGLSISNARNFHKLQQAEAAERKDREIAETLRVTMSELASALSLNDLLERILVSLDRVIPFSQALVYLKQGETMIFQSALSRKASGQYEKYRPPEKYINVNVPWITPVPLMLKDIEHLPNVRNYINPDKVHSWIGLPLMQRGEIIGFLSIVNHEKDVYNDETVKLAQAFGAEVSISLENARLFKELTEAAVTDSLTGLYNRRRFYELAVSEFARSLRYKRPLSAVMIDMDYFKRVNDTFGHLAGDQVLIWFANLCRKVVRGVDIIGRYGGEEFVMLLPETDLESAVILAERLREMIENTPILTSKGTMSITCSLGVAAMTRESKDLEQLLDQSDSALYRAKETGRNRVCKWEK